MIITRTPFRISFSGGGSDISSFYREHGGCVLSTAIQKYMYISIHPSFDPRQTALKYSRTEIVSDPGKIEHNYFRVILQKHHLQGVEIVSTADVPAGTGLGSSSSFTVGTLLAVYSYLGKYVSKERLASEACRIEIDELHNPIGKQDQYAAAYGGMNFIRFRRDDGVEVEPVIMDSDAMEQLQRNLVMFYTGQLHSASSILKEQKENIRSGSREQNLVKMCELTEKLRDQLHRNNIDELGRIMQEGWTLKKTLASSISSPAIDRAYESAMAHGALGGKLLGAGGGGFLLFYIPQERQKEVEEAVGLPWMPVRFDRQGASVIYVGDKPEGMEERN